jgi:uncharacterized protein (TIGR02452 family)
MLHVLPTLDDAHLAALRRRELDIPRGRALHLGVSAVQAIREGSYTLPDGRQVDWAPLVRAAVAAKRSIQPDDELPTPPARCFETTTVQITNETTLGAARRLVDAGARPLALNFANGVQPGGGFLRGARAQEETLCRCSALYATLVGDAMYAAHSKRALPDSSAWAILSPDVPVFRADDGTELPEPWVASFITCAAPYAPYVGRDASHDLMARRIPRVLEIARAFGYAHLVLGAWGCGAFANDPTAVAMVFREALEGRFAEVFEEVVFAITDWSAERRFLGPFRDVFARR